MCRVTDSPWGRAPPPPAMDRRSGGPFSLVLCIPEGYIYYHADFIHFFSKVRRNPAKCFLPPISGGAFVLHRVFAVNLRPPHRSPVPVYDTGVQSALLLPGRGYHCFAACFYEVEEIYFIFLFCDSDSGSTSMYKNLINNAGERCAAAVTCCLAASHSTALVARQGLRSNWTGGIGRSDNSPTSPRFWLP